MFRGVKNQNLYLGLGRGKSLHVTSKPMSLSVFTEILHGSLWILSPHNSVKNVMLLSSILFNKRTIEWTSWTFSHGGNNWERMDGQSILLSLTTHAIN